MRARHQRRKKSRNANFSSRICEEIIFLEITWPLFEHGKRKGLKTENDTLGEQETINDD